MLRMFRTHEVRREEELKALSLGVPTAVQMASLLRKRGVDLPEDILSDEELVRAIMEAKAL